MTHPYDLFEDAEHDSAESIGWAPDSLELIGYEFADDSDCDSIGDCPIVSDLVQVGAVQFDYGTISEMDAMQQQALSNLKPGKAHMSKGRKVLTDINNHPATNAALSAAAAVVPYGTIVAGAVKLGLSAAQGILALVDKFRKPPSVRARNAKRRAAKKIEKIEAKLRSGKGNSRRQKRRLRRIERRTEKKLSKLQELASDTREKVAAMPADVPEATRSKLLDMAGQQLGGLMTQAAAGSQEAKAGLVAVQFLGDKNLRKSKDYLMAVAKGLPGDKAASIASAAASMTDGDWKQIVSVAKKVSGNPKIPLNFSKVRKVANEAAKVLATRTNVAAKKRGKLKGILVPTSGAMRNLNSGGAEQDAKGRAGVMVLKTGKAIAGKWVV